MERVYVLIRCRVVIRHGLESERIRALGFVQVRTRSPCVYHRCRLITPHGVPICVMCLDDLTYMYAWAVSLAWITWRMPELCDVFESLDVCPSFLMCLDHLTCAWLCGAFWSSDVYPSYVMHLIHWRLFHLRDVVCLITWRVPACAIFINPIAKELNFILLSVLGSYVQWP